VAVSKDEVGAFYDIIMMEELPLMAQLLFSLHVF
jgi:hypothetical protein